MNLFEMQSLIEDLYKEIDFHGIDAFARRLKVINMPLTINSVGYRIVYAKGVLDDFSS